MAQEISVSGSMLGSRTTVLGGTTAGARSLTSTNGSELPLPALLRPERQIAARYATTTIDGSGRLDSRSLLQLLGWGPGCRLDCAVYRSAGVLVIVEGRDTALTRRGQLRLTLSARRSVDLSSGDPVLLMALPAQRVLVVFSMAAVDAMVLGKHEALLRQVL